MLSQAKSSWTWPATKPIMHDSISICHFNLHPIAGAAIKQPGATAQNG